jgi:hypothetical protein
MTYIEISRTSQSEDNKLFVFDISGTTACRNVVEDLDGVRRAAREMSGLWELELAAKSQS